LKVPEQCMTVACCCQNCYSFDFLGLGFYLFSAVGFLSF
jgi:hypothetical protein